MRQRLPQVELPIEFNSDKKVKYRSIEVTNNKIIEEMTDQNSFSLLGKLFETQNNITILGYLPENGGTPVVITISNNGRLVSSHILYETVKKDFGYSTVNIAKILSKRQILFTDSTIVRKAYLEGPDHVISTDSVSITHKKYLITKKGSVKLTK